MIEFKENNILNDILKVNTILNKYGITYNQIHSLIYENLRELKWFFLVLKEIIWIECSYFLVQ